MLFLSYARTDVEAVDVLYRDLDHAHRDPWRDLDVPGGKRWWDEILERIRDCDAFLILLSADALRSKACRAELDYAVELGRPIVPVQVGDVSVDLAPDAIRETTVIDLRSRSPETTIALLNAIDRAPAGLPLPNPLPDPPSVPLSPIGPLRERIRAETLTLHDQQAIAAELEGFADDVDHHESVAALVQEFGQRSDLFERVRPDVDRLEIRLASAPGVLGATPAGQERIALRSDLVNLVVRYLHRSTFTPILGHGLTDWLIGPRSQLAREWADSLDFPMAETNRTDLAGVAQFVSVMNDSETVREMLGAYLAEHLGLDPSPDPGAAIDAMAQAVRSSWHVSDREGAVNPQRILADLPCPIYVNAHPWGLLTEALHDLGKKPEVDFCRWRSDVYDWPTSVFDREPDYRPSVERPLVYHVFGTLSVPESIVITEDDYLDFMISVSSNRSLLPLPVVNALADSSLLLLGFDLTELDTRVLLRTLLSKEGGRLRKYSHVAAQVDPTSVISPVRARQFVEKYFGRWHDPSIDIYWGTVADFAGDLSRAWSDES